jgi:hypothetical protein
MSIFSSFANPAESGMECALYRGSNRTNNQRGFFGRQPLTGNRQPVSFKLSRPSALRLLSLTPATLKPPQYHLPELRGWLSAPSFNNHNHFPFPCSEHQRADEVDIQHEASYYEVKQIKE